LYPASIHSGLPFFQVYSKNKARQSGLRAGISGAMRFVRGAKIFSQKIFRQKIFPGIFCLSGNFRARDAAKAGKVGQSLVSVMIGGPCSDKIT
jgi:hypothetical protein